MHSPIEDGNMQTHHAFLINHANTNMNARFTYHRLDSALLPPVVFIVLLGVLFIPKVAKLRGR
jgi:hypothetical protein